MRTLAILISIVLTTSGCVHRLSMANNQQCASEGMVLDGVDMGSTSAASIGPNFSTYSTSARSNVVRCSMPKKEADKCKIGVYLKSMNPKEEFNQHIGWKNLLIGVGYSYLIPGIAAYYYFDNQRDQAYGDALKIIDEGTKTCESPQ